MNIVSFGFILFVFAVVGIYYALPARFRPQWLLAASLGFYLYADLRYLFFLAFSVVTVWAGARMLVRRKEHSRLLLALTAGLNLAVLATVKFFPLGYSLLEHLLGRDLPEPGLLVPLGISFYTLQAISYLVDVYRGQTAPQKSLWRFGLYMCFFPIILQGPISRYDQLAPQLYEAHALNYDRLCAGAQLALWGFFKKLVIADRAALLVNQVFNRPDDYLGAQLLAAILLYTVQLYTDFSGCVDISRGVAAMLGIDLAENFRRPLFATSIRDYWRRWHISLSSWFRDYVYIPLGGSRRGAGRKYLNTLVVFAFSGLWHGAGSTYLLWGLLQGLYLVAGSLSQEPRQRLLRRLGISDNSPLLRLFRQLGCYLLVSFSLLFFRAASLGQAVHMLINLVRGFQCSQLWNGALLVIGLDSADMLVLFLALLVLLAVSLLQEREPRSIRSIIAAQPLPLRWSVYLLGLFTVLIFGVYGPGYSSAQFIYMDF